ncbi:MAG: DNA-formamidopyrimidine glycosylase family protein [Solirubrobacterales bacterium]
MPELPEVEITARRLGTALEGAEVESALAAGVATLKTFEPSLDALIGARISGVRRIGKMLAVEFEPPPQNGLLLTEHPQMNGAGPLTLLVHLMSAGRLQVFDKRASLRDRRSRILVRIADGRELRLREFGTKQSAWAKLLARDAVAADEMVATLGPDAWPAPPLEEFAERLRQPRHLHPLLRDQRVIAGIGRSWVDEILWEAKLSPFKKGSELSDEEVRALHEALPALGKVIEHYEGVLGEAIPDRMPMPLRVHRREGQPCPRCGTTIEAVFFAEHQMNYCPKEQTGGRVLKDRRLSRLLK